MISFQLLCDSGHVPFVIEENGALLKQVDETENIMNENGSCSGGEMSFETMLISLLLLTIFVKKLRIST